MNERGAKKTTGRKREQLDADTRARRKVLADLERMTPKQLFELAVRAGIYTPDGKLTSPYRDDTDPSATRPRD